MKRIIKGIIMMWLFMMINIVMKMIVIYLYDYQMINVYLTALTITVQYT